MERPAIGLYLLTAALALGVLARSFYDIGLPLVAFLVLLAFAPALLFGGALLLIFALGLIRMEWASWNETDPYLESRLDKETALTGVIAREPDERASAVHLYIKTDHGLILATAPRGGEWRYGDEVKVEGKPKHPESFETELGRSFNYRGYLLAQGVAYMIPFAAVEKIAAGKGNPILAGIFRAKGAFTARLERVIPEPEAGLALGLLLGVKRAMGEELEDVFRRAGIVHIVVLSGYNVMIVVTFILYVLGRFLGRRPSVFVGLLSIGLFAIAVGFGATVVRASVMAALFLLMGLTGRVYLALRGLCVAGIVMILWNPYLPAFDVGFQLSFLATLGLILCSPYLEERLRLVPARFGIREFLIATLATQLFVLPLLLYQMGQFSIAAVIVNVLVLPAVAPAMLLSFLAGIAAIALPPAAPLIGFGAYLVLAYIIGAAEWFAALPFAAFAVPPFPFFIVPLSYLAIALTLWWLNREPDPLRGWKIEGEFDRMIPS